MFENAIADIPSSVLSYSTFILLALSTAAAICAKQRSKGLRHMRKWTTLALALVTIDYLVKCGAHPTGAVLAGLATWTIVTARSSAVYFLNFSSKDRNNPLQLGISIGSFALCLAMTLGSQWYLTGSIDAWTWLPLIGTAFGSLADSFNVEEYRLRSQFFMAVFHFAFGVVTNSWSLMIKTAIDAGACLAFDAGLGKSVAAAARSFAKRDLEATPSPALRVSPT
jgi:hypothetical protein